MWILVEEVVATKMAALVMPSPIKCLGWTIERLKGINLGPAKLGPAKPA